MTTPHRPTRGARTADRVARGLGWFSIGLGLAELLMPRVMARATGMKGSDRLLQAYGVREIATGLALLKSRDPTPWLWARVGGDALDIATLGREGRLRRPGTAIALAAVAGVTAIDFAAAQVLRADARRAQRPLYDYSGRRGLPLPAQEMRGAALLDFEMPEDMRTPAALRPLAGV
jgi:hypothetical protein